MSQGPMIETKQCVCGNTYKTDCATLGVNRKKCGICFLKESWIKEEKDVIGLIWFFAEKELGQRKGFNSVEYVKGLFEGKLDPHILNSGLDKDFLSNVLMSLSMNSFALLEVKDDVTKFVRDNGWEELVKVFLSAFRDKGNSIETKAEFLESRPFRFMDAMEYLEKNIEHKVRCTKWKDNQYIYRDNFGNLYCSQDGELYSPTIRHMFDEWEVVLS